MAYLFRLIVAGLAFFASSAGATVPAIYTNWSFPTLSLSGATPEAVCELVRTSSSVGTNATIQTFAPGSSASKYTCIIKRSVANGGSLYGSLDDIIATGAMSCPANGTLTAPGAATCNCNVGFVESGGKCVDPDTASCASLAGKDAGPKNWEGKADSFSFCDAYAGSGGTSLGGGKCIATATKDITWESPPGSGHFISQGAATYTGGKATTCTGTGGTGSDPAPSSPPDSEGKPPAEPGTGEAAPSPCPAGQAPGEVNGTRVCAPVGPDIEAKDRKNTTNPDGSKVAETGTTKCVDGQCTTAAERCTTSTAGAIACSTTTTVQGQGSFCNANKGSKACTGDGDGTGGSFSGNCAAGFKAESDDPVVNAMALEQHKRNCLLFETETEERTAYEADKVKGQAGTDQTTELAGNKTVSIGEADFDSSDALGGGACITDKSITVFGKAVALPFSRICPALGYIGQLLVVVAYLLAARIVIRG